ncbi:MAG: heme biosynthesis protein HemY [Alphaproteobacteria bacterium]|nr:heme biosynthesis protein HemY [Alphaproteobacteria bacterium]
MIRLVLFLIFIVALATGLAWLADRPGQIIVNWEGQEAKISVFHAVVALALMTGLALVTWSLLRHIWESPAVIGGYFNKRRQKRGLDALSSGMIAIGAGDRATATKYAIQARKSMPNEPLTHLLRAQAAQLSGDKATARRIYESMLASTDTEQLGLRGLFLEAEREGEREAAKQFAERAIALNPQLNWPVDALFDLQCKSHDWAGALATLAVARKNGHVEKASAERRRAVLLTAQAQDLEDKDPERALNLALDAHKLAADLVPAGAIAGRLLASRGATPKATKIVQQTWQKSPHPDLATAYAYARLGDSPRDRLDRVRKLAQLNPHSLESAIAVANAAIEAKDFTAARQALQPLMESRLTQRACTLMARIEGEEHGDKGRVREWLARAVNAPRDPAWTADGVVSEQWAAVSPVTGALDAFSWRVPVESMEKTADEIVARKLEELVALGAPLEVAVEVKDVTPAKTQTAGAGNGDAGTAKPSAAAPAKVAETAPIADADVIEAEELPAKSSAPAHGDQAETDIAASEPRSSDGAERGHQGPGSAKSAREAEERSIRAATAVRPSRASADPVSESPKSAIPAAPEITTSAAPAKPDAPSGARSPETSQDDSTAKGPAAEPSAAVTTSRPAAKGSAGGDAKPLRSAAPGKRVAAPKPVEKTEQQRTARSSLADARIFVSPRAPDDPGPDGDVVADVAANGPLKPFRHGAA